MPLRSDLIFLHGQRVPQCTHEIDKHFDDYQTLQYMAAGRVELVIGERRQVLCGRWFWSCYPGPRIAFLRAPAVGARAGRSSWLHRYIAFRGPLVARWTAQRLFPIHPPQRAPAGRGFGATFDRILDLSTRRDKWGHRLALHLLEAILVDLAEARESEVRSRGIIAHTPVEIASEMLRARSTPVDVDAGSAAAREPWCTRAIQLLRESAEGGARAGRESIAQSVGMAESTFRRRFRAATGLAPHAFVLAQRVSAARRLLTETDLPIKSIASRLGYTDVFFFTRQFRNFTGVPPALYRRSRQG